MSSLFETTTIKSLTLPNRFIRSATWEGIANDDGSWPDRLIDLMAELSRGGVALIITGHAYVSKEGQALPWQVGSHSDHLLPSLKKAVEAVHREGGRIALQLAHAGRCAVSQVTKLEALGPSSSVPENTVTCREMTKKEIARTVEAFGNAAARARKAGFDAVQIHSAHGYLLSQFLSPYYNRRTDEYGGSVENRARMHLEVVQSVRAAVGNDFPVLIKINAEDFMEGGLTNDDMLHVSEMVEKAGVDAIEMSGGTMDPASRFSFSRIEKVRSEESEVYYRDQAERFKKRIKVPLMLVGGIRSFGVAERVVEEGLADYISLCRPLIREPGLINRWKSGDRERATCISDNRCFEPALKGEGMHCVAEEIRQKKQHA
jgi:2,4-dienoyl-CoA reductase-like NADH-dependent reductase (Old Yellow Enzyme family)